MSQVIVVDACGFVDPKLAYPGSARGVDDSGLAIQAEVQGTVNRGEDVRDVSNSPSEVCNGFLSALVAAGSSIPRWTRALRECRGVPLVWTSQPGYSSQAHFKKQFNENCADLFLWGKKNRKKEKRNRVI